MQNILVFTNDTLFFEGLKYITLNEKDLNICGWARNSYELGKKIKVGFPSIVLVDKKNINSESSQILKNKKENHILSILLFGGEINTKERFDWVDINIPEDFSSNSIIEELRFSVEIGTPSENSVHLGERELDVLQLLEHGMSSKEIGDSLHISINTVKKHLNNIYKKLGVQNRVQAIKKVYSFRLV